MWAQSASAASATGAVFERHFRRSFGDATLLCVLPAVWPRTVQGRRCVRGSRFSQHGKTAYGLVEGDRIVEVAGNPFDGYERMQRTYTLEAVKIGVPVVPPTFYCVGLNYAAHVRE